MGSITKWPKIILFGDSLTQKSFDPENGLWGTLLADRLQRICDVVNRGFSGYTSRMCRVALPLLFSSENTSDIKAFVICLGANDACGEESKTGQYVPLEEYKENLSFMINYLQSIGIMHKKVILMTTPPYYHPTFVEFCKINGKPYPVRDNNNVGEYAEACCDIGRKHEIDVINLFSEIMKDENWPQYLIDGVHFSKVGSAKVFSLLWPLISERIKLNMILPAWSEMDPLHPEKMMHKTTNV